MSSLVVSKNSTFSTLHPYFLRSAIAKQYGPEMTCRFLKMYLIFCQSLSEMERHSQQSLQPLQKRIANTFFTLLAPSSSFTLRINQNQIYLLRDDIAKMHRQHDELMQKQANGHFGLDRLEKTVLDLQLTAQHTSEAFSPLSHCVNEQEEFQAKAIQTLCTLENQQKLLSQGILDFDGNCKEFAEKIQGYTRRPTDLDRPLQEMRALNTRVRSLEHQCSDYDAETALLLNSTAALEYTFLHFQQQLASINYVELPYEVYIPLNPTRRLSQVTFEVIEENEEKSRQSSNDDAARNRECKTRDHAIHAFVLDQMSKFHEECEVYRKQMVQRREGSSQTAVVTIPCSQQIVRANSPITITVIPPPQTSVIQTVVETPIPITTAFRPPPQTTSSNIQNTNHLIKTTRPRRFVKNIFLFIAFTVSFVIAMLQKLWRKVSCKS